LNDAEFPIILHLKNNENKDLLKLVYYILTNGSDRISSLQMCLCLS